MIVKRKTAIVDSTEMATPTRFLCFVLLPATIWSWTSSFSINSRVPSSLLLVQDNFFNTRNTLLLNDNYRYKITKKRSNTALYESPATKDRSTIDEETSASTTTLSSSSSSSSTTTTPPITTNTAATSEGLPWWWDMVWKLDIMKVGQDGEDIIFGDSANVLRTNIEQIYGGFPSRDGCPLAVGDISDIADGTMFIGLQRYFKSYGSPYKLCFGPKSFLVISDPVQARHILRDANVQYDKVSVAAQISAAKKD
jgi:hypothetical protein